MGLRDHSETSVKQLLPYEHFLSLCDTTLCDISKPSSIARISTVAGPPRALPPCATPYHPFCHWLWPHCPLLPHYGTGLPIFWPWQRIAKAMLVWISQAGLVCINHNKSKHQTEYDTNAPSGQHEQAFQLFLVEGKACFTEQCSLKMPCPLLRFLCPSFSVTPLSSSQFQCAVSQLSKRPHTSDTD